MAPSLRRKTLLITLAVGGLFLVGTVFTEFVPVPLVIRAQFFRSSRLLMIIALIIVAHGCVSAWRLPWRKPASLSRFAAWLEFFAALLVAASLAIPALLVLLPLALTLALVAALVSGRLAWHQALVGGMALVVCLLAWQTIHFIIPGLPPATFWTLAGGGGAGGGSWIDWRGQRLPSATGWCLLGAVIALWLLSTRRLKPPVYAALALGSALVVALSVAVLVPRILRQSSGPWEDAQRWVRLNTPVDALILTPAQQSGFRIHSQRAIVGEWRDGTQLYFAGAFAKTWWERMLALQPGIVVDADGTSLLSPGKSLERLEDPQVIALAKQFKASYVVLPHDDARTLEKVYDNNVWAVYRPEVAVVSMGSHSTEMVQEDNFVRQTAFPNIDRYRKSDVHVQIVDAAGQPLFGAQYRIAQVASSFQFGVSLPFFKRPRIDIHADYLPPAVTDKELARALDVFNASVITFSGQWRFMEPQRGTPDFADLDAYVDWCQKQNIRTEFHPLAGYAPAWLKALPASEQNKLLLARIATLAKRYDSRIADWEITASGPTDLAVQMFAELRKASPTARVGLVSDARLWTVHTGAQAQAERFAGLDDLKRLKEKKVKVDFIALQARRPVGLWAAGDELYSLLDGFAKENVPIHLTEMGVPVAERIEGSVREGRWTPELQAEYYERLFTVCFSHPGVEAINIMGIGADTWLPGQGLLNERDEPTPAYDALQRLVLQRFRTRLSGGLGVDGRVLFRGFHGTYQLQLTTPDGQATAATFAVRPGDSNRIRFRWDAAKNQLQEAP